MSRRNHSASWGVKFGVQLPPEMAKFVARSAEHQLCSAAAVIRQLVARGIADLVANDPPPWFTDEEGSES
jgi:hypothetical protein